MIPRVSAAGGAVVHVRNAKRRAGPSATVDREAPGVRHHAAEPSKVRVAALPGGSLPFRPFRARTMLGSRHRRRSR